MTSLSVVGSGITSSEHMYNAQCTVLIGIPHGAVVKHLSYSWKIINPDDATAIQDTLSDYNWH